MLHLDAHDSRFVASLVDESPGCRALSSAGKAPPHAGCSIAVQEGQRCWASVESLLQGHYDKWFDNVVNAKSADDATYSSTLEAFSHWTHHVTSGYLMVVDVQGVRDSVAGTFVLTDPAIHCQHEHRFGRTNLGRGGISARFVSHRCNDICAALGLPAHTEQKEPRLVGVGTKPVK
jgi:hypothetical protein